MSTSTASALPISTVRSPRTAALAGIAGGAITAASGIVAQAVVQPSTSVPDDHWSYPWSSAALVRVSLLGALAQALVLIALVAFARTGAAGTTRAARAGVATALAGTALLLVGELASILVRHEHADAAGAIAVGATFGVAILLSAVGFLLAGRGTWRAGHWQGWRRPTPLATGAWCVALLGINATKALPTGIAVYGLCLLALCVALYTAPSPDDRSRR